MIARSLAPRLLPDRRFPPYAYLPGQQPHPVRDPLGHSYQSEPETVVREESALESEAFLWGIDLFNHGYYWEAHEAWEPLWHATKGSREHRMFFKGLILLAAAGVKIREEKPVATDRHARRAAGLFDQMGAGPGGQFESALGMAPSALAELARVAAVAPRRQWGPASGEPEPVFDFMLARKDSRTV